MPNDETPNEVDESGADQEIEIPAELLAEGEEEETEDTETEADGEATASAADEAEDKPTPPTAEELGLNPKIPAEKVLFEKALKTWTKWAAKFDAKQKATPKATETARTEEQPPAQQQAAGDAWDPYTVPEWKGDPEPEDSVLHGAEADIDRRINAAIKGTLDAMRSNDARLQQQARTATAQEILTGYAADLQAHPEFSRERIAKFITGRWGELAVEDPKGWISAVAAETGITPGWRNAQESSEASATQQRGQQHQRIAKKPVASMARTTSAQRPGVSAQRTDLDSDSAFESNWDRFHANGRL